MEKILLLTENIHYSIWIFFAILLTLYGDYTSKMFVDSKNILYALLTVGIYALDSILWMIALNQKNVLSIIGPLWATTTLVGVVLIGAFVFKESLTQIQLVGITFGLLSVIILSI